MKKNEVPQDDANVLEGKFKPIKYATNEDGSYTKVHTVGWEPENIALEQAWEEIHLKLEIIAEEIEKGKSSPIKFFMEKCLMEPPMLAQYMGISRWRLKRHFKPRGFAKLKPQQLDKYAEIFGVSRNELTNFDPKRTP